MYAIEKHVPIPSGRPSRQRYPHPKLNVGESFFVPVKDNRTEPRVRSAVCMYGLKHDRMFTVKKVDGGVRVWRIA